MKVKLEFPMICHQCGADLTDKPRVGVVLAGEALTGVPLTTGMELMSTESYCSEHAPPFDPDDWVEAP